MNYEGLTRWHYSQAASAIGVNVLGGNIEMHVYAAYKYPKSEGKKKANAMAGKYAPKKPDIDNVVKIIADALNGVAWADDNQLVKLAAEKRYTLTEPYVKVTIKEICE